MPGVQSPGGVRRAVPGSKREQNGQIGLARELHGMYPGTRKARSHFPITNTKRPTSET
jgi:hypothetical protein